MPIDNISYIDEKTDRVLNPDQEKLMRTLVFLMSKLKIARYVTDFDATWTKFHTASHLAFNGDITEVRYAFKNEQGATVTSEEKLELNDIFTNFEMFKFFVNELKEVGIPTTLMTFSGHVAIDKLLIKAGVRKDFLNKIYAGTRDEVRKTLLEHDAILKKDNLSEVEIAKRGIYHVWLDRKKKKQGVIEQDNPNSAVLFTADADGGTAEYLQSRGKKDITFGQHGYELTHVSSKSNRDETLAANVGLTEEKLKKLAHKLYVLAVNGNYIDSSDIKKIEESFPEFASTYVVETCGNIDENGFKQEVVKDGKKPDDISKNSLYSSLPPAPPNSVSVTSTSNLSNNSPDIPNDVNIGNLAKFFRGMLSSAKSSNMEQDSNYYSFKQSGNGQIFINESERGAKGGVIFYVDTGENKGNGQYFKVEMDMIEGKDVPASVKFSEADNEWNVTKVAETNARPEIFAVCTEVAKLELEKQAGKSEGRG